MRKKITFIEVIIVIVVIVVVVKGYQFWNKDEVPEVTSEIEKSVTPSSLPVVHEMLLIYGETFQMGDDDKIYNNENPLHTVKISSFYMDKYEVTNNEYVEFLNDMGNQQDSAVETWIDMNGESRYQGIRFTTVPDDSNASNTGYFEVKSGFENRPVVYVTWYGTIAYCNWLSEQRGFTPVYGADPDNEDPANWLIRDGYRLPTEAEWEYACRAGTDTNFYWGDERKVEKGYIHMCGETYETGNHAYCWLDINSKRNHHEVTTLKPNPWGLYHMGGNVLEWCNDWYDNSYYQYCVTNNIDSDPVGPISGSYRVLRGGSWCDSLNRCRSAYRTFDSPDHCTNYRGFRLCRSVR